MYLLFDIGATKTRIAVSKDRVTFDEPVIFNTVSEYESGIKKFIKEARALTPQPIKGIAGGITGTLDQDRTHLTRSPNLSGWVGSPIEEDLRKEFDCPVFIENDASIVGLGEAVSGAGIGEDIVVYITVSTGVGGTRIVSGEIDEHSYGFEPGHELINMQDSLEDLVSGTAVEERFNKKPYEIPQDDPLWDELAEKLAFGIHNMIVHWSPNAVVLGGSMIVGDPVILIKDIEKHLNKISKVYPTLPNLKKATLGAVGGLHGALHYLNSRLG